MGRAIPEKGLLEAAAAASSALTVTPGWTVRFVISEAQRQAAYSDKVARALGLGQAQSRARIEYDLPWPEVKARLERAAIALVASLWREPFGRTALEAHAAGAAVVSSGTGGLREISGEHALYANPTEAGALKTALLKLMRDDDLRQKLAVGGRSRVERKFRMSELATRADEFYSTCLTGRG